MSLRMISGVLKPKDVTTHCPLCGRAFSRFPSNEEHIYPKWLQHHHNLWNRRLTIPNFLGKKYKTVKITICERCNGKTFGKLETRIAPLLTSADPFAAAATLDDDELAVWLGKIFWLLVRKSHSAMDYRTRDLPQPERILPDELLPGTLFLGMLERTYAMRRGMACCHDGDLAIPEFFYGPPYSLYRFKSIRAIAALKPSISPTARSPSAPRCATTILASSASLMAACIACFADGGMIFCKVRPCIRSNFAKSPLELCTIKQSSTTTPNE